MAKIWAAVLLGAASRLLAEDVITLTTATFEQTLKDNRQLLVEFYAPWCGHCKKLAPEYEQAATTLKASGIPLAKVDATEEKELATKYSVKGFPTMVWFEDGAQVEYDGGRTASTIVDWVMSMTGPAVAETMEPSPPTGDRPRVVLQGESLLPAFEEAAKAHRRKASWYFVKSGGGAKVVLTHKGEDPVELTSGYDVKESVISFLVANELPLFGKLDGESFDRYLNAGKGLVWSLFPSDPEGDAEAVGAKHRPMMSEVAQRFKGRYFVTYTDTDKFKDAVDNMLGVTKFPAIAVQKKAGDKKKFIYDGDMTAAKISAFIEEVDAGRVEPKLKSEPVPPASDDPVKVVVGSTMQQEVFTANKDVLLEVYAPWCGHCKKLEPEFIKLAKKIKKEELHDLLVIAKIDGTANDSPVDSVDWSGFPTFIFAKAGQHEPLVYDGERTAKGLWKYIKKQSTHAAEIRERLEKRKGDKKRAEEL